MTAQPTAPPSSVRDRAPCPAKAIGPAAFAAAAAGDPHSLTDTFRPMPDARSRRVGCRWLPTVRWPVPVRIAGRQAPPRREDWSSQC